MNLRTVSHDQRPRCGNAADELIGSINQLRIVENVQPREAVTDRSLVHAFADNDI
jgi:hypothetical protein